MIVVVAVDVIASDCETMYAGVLDAVVVFDWWVVLLWSLEGVCGAQVVL